MSSGNEIDRSLNRLKAAIAPPAQPIGLENKILPEGLPPLPPDLLAFVHTYGSGYFENGGMFLTVLNPYDVDYWKKQNTDLNLVRQFKEEEGDEIFPYPVWPDRPGLLLWGYGQNRKHFFWLTDGDPSKWPVIVMYDIKIFTRFDMSMLQFLENLLCGDIDCSFIGCGDAPNHRIDPSSKRYVARILPA